jgi:predicted DNA-binding WGR domain protein
VSWYGYCYSMEKQLTDLAVQPQIMLCAIDEDRNIRRGYMIERTRDLFGWHVVSWAWGRLGSRPTRRVSAFASEQAAIAFARQLLARRGSAPKRIGVAYREHRSPI